MTVSEENVLSILPLADEYQMAKLKQDCENWLLAQLEHLPGSSDASSIDLYMRYLTTAQKYRLEHLMDTAIEQVSALNMGELEACEHYKEIEQSTLVTILKRRVQALESANAKLNSISESWRRKHDDLEDCLKKMSREKLTIKRALDEVDGAWELKGSDARCIDPVHIYGPRNYSCDKCTRQVNTYIQAKIWYLLNRGSTSAGITWPK